MKIFKKYNKRNKKLVSNNKFNHINLSFEKKYIKFSVVGSLFKNNQIIKQCLKKKKFLNSMFFLVLGYIISLFFLEEFFLNFFILYLIILKISLIFFQIYIVYFNIKKFFFFEHFLISKALTVAIEPLSIYLMYLDGASIESNVDDGSHYKDIFIRD